MLGRIAGLFRHPVKGFSPESLTCAELQAGAAFPCDRLYAVENGPSGFDPAAPVYMPKSRMTVLAQIPALARARTVYDDTTGVITVRAEGQSPLVANLSCEAGRAAFAAWLTRFLDPEDVRGPLLVLSAPSSYRFMDDAEGAVSLINLESLRDLERQLGRAIEPARFRANLHVEGWPAWSELSLRAGAKVRLGGVEARVVKPIVRCAAIHVDPAHGERDLDLVAALYRLYGHRDFGLYLQVAWGGRVAEGDLASAGEPPAAMAGAGGEHRAVPHV